MHKSPLLKNVTKMILQKQQKTALTWQVLFFFLKKARSEWHRIITVASLQHACFCQPLILMLHYFNRLRKRHSLSSMSRAADGWPTARGGVSPAHSCLLSSLQSLGALSFLVSAKWATSSRGDNLHIGGAADLCCFGYEMKKKWNPLSPPQQMERFIFPGLKWQNQI